MCPRLPIHREGLLEFRTGRAIPDSRRNFAQVQPLRRRVRGTQQAFGSFANVCGAPEVGLRSLVLEDARVLVELQCAA